MATYKRKRYLSMENRSYFFKIHIVWFSFWTVRSNPSQMFFKVGALKNLSIFLAKYMCQSLFFNKVAKKKQTLGHVFSCEFSDIFKNTFSHWTLLVASSGGNAGLLTISPQIFWRLSSTNFTWPILEYLSHITPK